MLSQVKQPGDVRRISLAFGLSNLAGGVIVTSEARGLVPAAPAMIAAGIVAGPLGNVAEITISGGGAGEQYLVTAVGTDDAGLTEEQEIQVAVMALDWVMPDGGAPWLSIADFVLRFGLEETVRMTDRQGDGRIDGGYLVAALADAQATVHAYISGRYTVDGGGDAGAVPPFIAAIIADLARARLYPEIKPEGVDEAAKQAMRHLEKIQSGALTLGNAAAPSQQMADAPVRIRAGKSVYPDRLKGF